ncbi:MAG: peptidylprolyl isomerase [Thermodesulfobacteriota bacterium]
MRIGKQLLWGLVSTAAAWQLLDVAARAQDAATPPAAPVVEIGDFKVTAPQLTAEFAFLPPPVLQRLKVDDNAARIFAVDWYARAMLARAAKEDGFLAKHPGLVAAAASSEREVIAKEYLRATTEQELRATEQDVEQYKKLNPELCRLMGRYRIARVGVVVGRNASPQELKLASERFAEIEKRLAAGEDFAKVADETSDYSARGSGGDMGWIEEDKVRQSPHGEAILKLGVGDKTPAIDTGQGKVIYRLLEKTEAGELPVAECRPKVEQALRQQYTKDLLLRRIDELAARFGAKMNLDAFIAAVRAVDLPEGWERTWQPENAS